MSSSEQNWQTKLAHQSAGFQQWFLLKMCAISIYTKDDSPESKIVDSDVALVHACSGCVLGMR
jgi:hypothetical protein